MIVGESSHKPSIDAGRYYANGSVRSLLAEVVDLERDCHLSDAIKCDKQFCSVKGKTLNRVAERCCTRFLSREIALLQPTAIVAVGRIAFEFLTGITGGYVSRQNDGKGYFVADHRIPVHPVIHPSNANRMYGRVPWQIIPYAESFAQIVRDCLTGAGN
ncbi:uracil-DNA glycosylase family protein [Propionispora vibrioides]|nr:uracil-DNA glycosylase family protein [Propionispora vibrioides]